MSELWPLGVVSCASELGDCVAVILGIDCNVPEVGGCC